MLKSLTLLGVILATFFWSSAFIIGSDLAVNSSISLLLAERFIIASIVMLFWMFWREKNNLQTLKKNIIPYILLGLVGITCSQSATFIGLKSTTSTNAALIFSLTPVVTPIIYNYINKVKMLGHQILGISLSVTGVFIVLSKGSVNNVLNIQFNLGDFTVVCGLLCWCFYNVLTQKCIKDSTPLQTTTYTILFGSVGLILVALLTNDDIYNVISQQSNRVIINLMYLGVMCTFLGYLFWVNGATKLGASNISIYFNLVPIFVVLIGLFYGKIPNISVCFGILMVLCGVIFTNGFYKIIFKN
ncbi:hypothetical protein CF386_09810 [Paraphotobacterium marinum]|uniref:EamA domain-containing protein n=1 Tax=Paraphotobacterium marinum TaxID=1755811 RepID=A0A220VG03_9GAMM|nr:DMT family transporter [Paraphotobacterium marinum]ASK79348.1 hypothetical protein CF386_09810 [Paraphotobacterium marinum]